MQKIKIRLKKQIDNSYDIALGSGVLRNIGKDLKQMKKKEGINHFVIICDNNVEKLYSPVVAKSLLDSGLDVDIIGFPSGEHNKNRQTKEYIEDEMVELEIGRDTMIIALGGGITGDIAGFMAATYMRGIPFVQIPTTLLAMVDSSIGGKVGVDTPLGKNLIGAFYQPKKVYIDIDVLKTLPERELGNGLAEIIKHALIKDKELFAYLEKNIDKIKKLDKKALLHIIKRNIEIKASVVEKDEKEKGLRKILNYGHTIGHAIESLSNYTMSHGNCVAIGMNAAVRISHKIFGANEGLIKRQNILLMKSGLSIRLPSGLKLEDILDKMKMDKKNIGKQPRFTLLKSVGKVAYNIEVPEKILVETIAEIR